MQHGCDLRSGGGALRVEPVAVALEHPAAHRPLHRGHGVGADLVRVGVGPQPVGQLRRPVAHQVAEEDRRELLAGDRVVRAEAPVAVAADHALGRRPADRLGVPRALGHVGEVHGIVHHRAARLPPQDRDEHRAGHALVRREAVGGRAGHQPLVVDVLHVVTVPGVRAHVREGQIVGLGPPTGVDGRAGGEGDALDRLRQGRVGVPAGEDVAAALRHVPRQIDRAAARQPQGGQGAAAVGVEGQGVVGGAAAATAAGAVAGPVGGEGEVCGHRGVEVILFIAHIPAVEGVAGFGGGGGGLRGLAVGDGLFGDCAAVVRVKGHGIVGGQGEVERIMGEFFVCICFAQLLFNGIFCVGRGERDVFLCGIAQQKSGALRNVARL